MKRVVLLGTGTDVGKTYVGQFLLRSWAREVGPCLGLKPIESGVVVGQETDASRLDASRRTDAPVPAHFTALPEPISPHLAARRSGHRIDVSAAANWVKEQESQYIAMHDNASAVLSVVETAGGTLSPLSDEATCADLAAALEPSIWVIVAPDSLGVLHDVAAALLSLAQLYRSADAVILSAAKDPDPSSGTNAAELENVVFPRLGPGAAPRSSRVVTVPRGGGDPSDLLALLSLLSRSLGEKSI